MEDRIRLASTDSAASPMGNPASTIRGGAAPPDGRAGEPTSALTSKLLASEVANHAAERVERFGQQHRRGIYLALGRLQFLCHQRQTVDDNPSTTLFRNDPACEGYLIGRLQASPPGCPRCAKYNRHFLPSRRRFECAGGGAQFGPRTGTGKHDAERSQCTTQ